MELETFDIDKEPFGDGVCHYPGDTYCYADEAKAAITKLEKELAEVKAELEATVTECMAAKSNEDILKAERERYRQMAEHYFSPSETDRDTCRRCSLDFRDPVHTRAKRLEGE